VSSEADRGSIILLHDRNERGPTPDEYYATVSLVAKGLAARGLRVVPAGELLAAGRRARRLWIERAGKPA
jgi:hypothetical protein